MSEFKAAQDLLTFSVQPFIQIGLVDSEIGSALFSIKISDRTLIRPSNM